jgi:ATP-dependent DNA ligase
LSLLLRHCSLVVPPKGQERSWFANSSTASVQRARFLQLRGRRLALATDRGQSAGLVYFAFDLLFLDGINVAERPLIERKGLLQH